MTQFKRLCRAETKRNFMHEGIDSRSNWMNCCYCLSVECLFPSLPPSKNIKIQIYRNIFVLLGLCGYDWPSDIHPVLAEMYMAVSDCL